MTDRIIRIWGHDPGRVHYGIAVIEVNTETCRADILQCAELQNTITNIARGLTDKRASYVKELEDWYREFKPQAIIAERFQTRGFGGTLIEEVNLMMGCLIQRFRKRDDNTLMPIKLLPASQWKNAFNRTFPITLQEFYGQVNVSPHQIDAGLLAMYGAELGLKAKLKFTPNRWSKGFENTTLTPKKRKR